MSHRKQKISKFKLSAQVVAAFVVAIVSSLAHSEPASAADCSDVLTPLSSFVVNGVNANKSFYVQAMNETGVPWEMLAAIHYRETSFSHTNPSNGQGIFQFANGAGGPYPAGPVSDGEFYRQLKFMASKLQNDYVWRGSVPRERRQLQANETNMMIVKDTLFSYNGRASVYANQAAQYGYNPQLQPYEGSPYVMNRFDCPRARMGIITRDYGSIDGTDTRYGAFTVFARLRGDDFWRSLWSSQGGFGNSFILAKSDDPNDQRQWVLYGNVKQHVPNADIIYAWGLQNVSLVTVSASALNSISTGPDLDRLFRLSGSQVLYFADNGKKYRVNSMSMLDSWNIRGLNISDVTLDLFNLPADSGPLGYAVKSASSDTVYVIDGKNGSGQIVARPFLTAELMGAWEGDHANIITLSNAMFDSMDNAIGSAINTTKITNNGVEYQALAGMRMPVPAGMGALYPGSALTVSDDTIARLSPTAPVTHMIRSGGSYQVYMIDGGKKHPVSNPAVLDKWLPNGSHVNVVNDGYVGSIPDGTPVSSYLADDGASLYVMDKQKDAVPTNLDSAYRNNSFGIYSASTTLTALLPSGNPVKGFVKAKSAPHVYLLDNSGKRRYLRSVDVANLYGSFTGITTLSDDIVNSYGTDQEAQLFVSDGTNEYVLNNGSKSSVDALTKTEWGLGSPQVYSDGTLGRFASGDALPTSFQGSGYYFLIRGGVSYITADVNIAKVWGIDTTPVEAYQLGFQLIPQTMLTRLVQASGDGRIYVINNGNWYYLTGEQFANISIAGEPRMRLDPAKAPNTITNWSNVVVKNGAGTHYVIDGGTKRILANSIIQNHWTSNGALTVPTVSDGFLALLPEKVQMERAIKGSSSPIYSAEGARKHWIMSAQTLSQSYAPYTPVSDSLLNAMPNANSIP